MDEEDIKEAEIRKKFEEYFLEDKPLGAIKDFFLKYEIEELSYDNLNVILEYIVKHNDYISFEYLLDSFSKFKQDIIECIIKAIESEDEKEIEDEEFHVHMIEDEELVKFYNKKKLFKKIIEEAEKNSISDNYARILLKYISGVDLKLKQYNGIFNDLSFASSGDIMSIISKMDDDSKFEFISSLCNEYCFSSKTYDSESSSRYTIYRDMISDFINCLSPNQIEELLASKKFKNYKYKIDYFCQIARKNPEKYNNIAKMLKNRSDKIELPDMSDIDKRIENGDIFTLDEMNDFYKKIDLIRQKNGIIPEKYCDFAIRNNFLSEYYEKDSDDSLSEINFLSFCLIDKAFHILKHEGIDDVITYVDFIDKGAIRGKYNDNDKTIFLSIFVIELLQQGKYNTIIQTLFHEIQHAIQYKNINSNNLNNFNEYKMLKENLIKKYGISEYDYDFYTKNYESVTEEVDARIAGRQKMYNYLKSLGIPSNKILDGSGKNYNGDVYKFLTDEATNLYNTKKEFIFDDNKKSMDSIFDELIKENGPEVIENNPILKYEYNDDGTRKCSMQILQEYEELMLSKDDSPANFSLQEYLIKKDYKLDPDKVKEMIYSDATYLEGFTPKTEKGRELIEEVIIYRILNYLLKMYDEISDLKKNNGEYSELLEDAKAILAIVSDYKDRNVKKVQSDMHNINLHPTDNQKLKELSQMIDSIKQQEIDYSRQILGKVG